MTKQRPHRRRSKLGTTFKAGRRIGQNKFAKKYRVVWSELGPYGLLNKHNTFPSYEKARDFATTLDSYREGFVEIELYINGDLQDSVNAGHGKTPLQEPWIYGK